MKKARHSVAIWVYPPDGHVYQTFYLQMDDHLLYDVTTEMYDPPTNSYFVVDTQYSPLGGWNHLAGPYLWDCSLQTIVSFKKLMIDPSFFSEQRLSVEKLVQAQALFTYEPPDPEGNLDHTFASGVLRTYDGTLPTRVVERTVEETSILAVTDRWMLRSVSDYPTGLTPIDNLNLYLPALWPYYSTVEERKIQVAAPQWVSHFERNLFDYQNDTIGECFFSESFDGTTRVVKRMIDGYHSQTVTLEEGDDGFVSAQDVADYWTANPQLNPEVDLLPLDMVNLTTVAVPVAGWLTQTTTINGVTAEPSNTEAPTTDFPFGVVLTRYTISQVVQDVRIIPPVENELVPRGYEKALEEMEGELEEITDLDEYEAYRTEWSADILATKIVYQIRQAPHFVNAGIVAPPDSRFDDDTVSGLRARLIDGLALLNTLTPPDASFLATDDAVSALRRSNINGLAFVKDLFAIRELVRPLMKLKQQPLNLASWRNLILWWKYGVKLTWQDCGDLYKALVQIRKYGKTLSKYVKYKNSLHCRYGTYRLKIPHETLGLVKHRTNERIVVRLELPVADKPLAALTEIMGEMDFWLNTQNVWDTIPFSFVVDWFVNFGRLFRQFDYSAECDRYTLRERIGSHKNSVTLPQDYFLDRNLVGSVYLEAYSRTYFDYLPDPPWTVGDSSFYKHWLEGLLIAWR